MPTAVILARVSTEEQGRTGYSIQEQLRECRAKAQALGATTILEFTDEMSGDVLDRPGLNAAREAVRRGGVKWFITLDPDRLSRKLMNQLIIAEELDKHGCELVFIQHNYQKTPEGQLFFQLRGAIAEFEKAKILERTIRGKRGKMRSGKIASYFNVYGYYYLAKRSRHVNTGRIIVNPAEAGTLVVNEAEAVWVRRMFDWLTNERLSLMAIANRLNELGVPAPRGSHWYRNTVRRILRNPIYMGQLYLNRVDTTGDGRQKVRSRDEWVKIEVPPIISEEQFLAAQKAIDGLRYTRPSRTRLLSGLVTCGRCGVHWRYRASGTAKRKYLTCSLRYPSESDVHPDRKKQRCPIPSIRADKLEPFVWQTVREWILNPEALRQTLLERSKSPVRQEVLNSLEMVTQALEEAERERSNLVYLFMKGLTNREQAEKQLEALTRRINSLQERRDELQRAVAMSDETSTLARLDRLQETLAAVRKRLDKTSEEEKRFIIRTLVEKVVINGPTPEEWEIIPTLPAD